MIENPIFKFLIQHEFIIEIFLSACFFLPWKDRRKFWYLILPAFILLSGAIIHIPNRPEMVYYLLIIICVVFYSLCSFKLDIMQALFYTTDIYALQFCTSSLYYMIIPQLDNWTKDYWISHIIKMSIALLIVYPIIFFLIVRKKKYKKTTFHHTRMIPTCLFGLFVFSCLSVIYKWDYKRFYMKPMTLNIVQILFSTVAFFVILVNDINCRNHELSEEQKIISFLLEKEKSQYDQTKKIIERINTREHDLRQQMNNMSETQKEELNDIESSRISKFATGNQSIDIMLSEHAYLCSQKNIELICSVHGELLEFMKPHHIASIFSNALTNAENYLDMVEEKEKKIIRVSLNEANDNIILVFQNYLKDQVRFSKNLPITTSSDKALHGYGMKSIQNIVELYNGILTISQKNNLFTVTIIFNKEEIK